MKIFTTGERVWILSIVLFFIWAIIGSLLKFPVKVISVFGSIGMVLFVIIMFLSIIILRNKNEDK